MKRVVLLSVLSLTAMPFAANADTLTFVQGAAGDPQILAGTTVETFNTRTVGNLGVFTDPNFAQFSGTGVIADGTTPGTSAEPWPDTTNYLAVTVNQAETVSFNQGVIPTSFSLYWGSVDAYNQLEVFYKNGTDQIFASPPPANGNQNSPLTNGEVTVSGSLAIASVVFSDFSSNAFEFDNFSIPSPGQGGTTVTPLPGTLALFAGGLAMLGMAGVRRRKREGSFLPSVVSAV
jgi:hypothetical protein